MISQCINLYLHILDPVWLYGPQSSSHLIYACWCVCFHTSEHLFHLLWRLYIVLYVWKRTLFPKVCWECVQFYCLQLQQSITVGKVIYLYNTGNLCLIMSRMLFSHTKKSHSGLYNCACKVMRRGLGKMANVCPLFKFVWHVYRPSLQYMFKMSPNSSI